MAKLIVIALIIASLAAANAQRPVATASCTASGDPHFKTFDNCYHDFQGQGTYVAAKNSLLEVQYHAEFCNAAKTVTCIKAVYVAFQFPGNASSKVVVKMNVYQNAANNNVTIDKVYYTWSNLTNVFASNGLANVTKQDPYFIVDGASSGGWKVQAAQHVLIVNLPYTGLHLQQTYGVCGFFDNDPINDFTAANGTRLEKCGTNVRVNNANTNSWGASFFVTPANSLGGVPFMLENKFTLLDDPVVPNSTAQEQLNKITFTDFDSYNSAKDRCQAMAGDVDKQVVDNCVYDAAVIGDFVMAASNQAAAVAARDSTSSSSSALGGGAIAGIVLGCVAFVSLLTALVMYIRLRKLRTEYSRALIVRSQAQDTNAQTGSGAIAENL